jgi:hypothetical protein
VANIFVLNQYTMILPSCMQLMSYPDLWSSISTSEIIVPITMLLSDGNQPAQSRGRPRPSRYDKRSYSHCPSMTNLSTNCCATSD